MRQRDTIISVFARLRTTEENESRDFARANTFRKVDYHKKYYSRE
jgi:hypothetical protein